MADVRQRKPTLRLIRVGGPFTAEQRALARDLGILDAVLVLPLLDRSTLAAVYRRSALVLMPSEREGFGLPVLEALACGTPVVASDIPALREVGAAAATYCAVGDIEAWTSAVERLLDERRVAPAQWRLRCEAAQRRAAAFSWSHYAAHVASIYTRLAQGMRMLTVLHVGKFYPPVAGGMERVVQSLCHATRGRLESRVLAVHTGPGTIEEVVEGVPVTRVGTWGAAGSVPVAPSLAAHLKRAEADIMIVHEPNPWALLSYLVARPRIPLAIWFHSEVVRPRSSTRRSTRRWPGLFTAGHVASSCRRRRSASELPRFSHTSRVSPSSRSASTPMRGRRATMCAVVRRRSARTPTGRSSSLPAGTSPTKAWTCSSARWGHCR